MRTQLVDGLFADLLQVVRFLRVYAINVGHSRQGYLSFHHLLDNRSPTMCEISDLLLLQLDKIMDHLHVAAKTTKRYQGIINIL